MSGQFKVARLSFDESEAAPLEQRNQRGDSAARICSRVQRGAAPCGDLGDGLITVFSPVGWMRTRLTCLRSTMRSGRAPLR